MLYYPIEVEEGKEFSCKKEIESIIPNSIVLTPIESSVVEKNNKMFRVYRKRVQGYVLIAVDALTKKDIKRIINLENILGFIYKPGLDEVETISKEEADLFISESINYKKMLKKNVLLIEGTYAGYYCRVDRVVRDQFEVIVNIKNSPKAVVPIWYIAEEV